MGFQTAQVTLFAIVRYDHSAGQHRVVGVQTRPVPLICSQAVSIAASWAVQAVSGGYPLSMFEVDHNSASIDQAGSIALDFAGTAGVNADVFVNNGSITVSIIVPNTLGDGGLPAVHDLTVNLRALASRELLSLGAQTAPLGTGSTPLALAASGNPLSDAGGVLPAWNALFWNSSTAGASFTPAGAGIAKTVEGNVGHVALEFASADPAPFPDVASRFDGSAAVTLLGSTKSVDCGQSDLEIVAGTTAPLVNFDGLVDEVGVSPGATKDIFFRFTIEDDAYFSTGEVTVTFNWTGRNSAAPVGSTVYQIVAGVWQLAGGSAVPAGVSISLPNPSIADTARPPINPALWGGLYSAAASATSSMSCGDGTADGNAHVQLQDGRFEQFEIQVSVTDHAGNGTNEARQVLVAIPSDIVLCLDYSGSMASPPDGGGPAGAGVESKWDAAKSAANRFHAVYRAVSSAIGGVDSLTNRIGYVRFWWDDASLSDQSSVEVNLVDVEGAGAPAAGALVVDPDPAWLQYTPIADGVLLSAGQLAASGGWRRRVIVAMTDGYHNRGTDFADIRTTDPADAHFIANTAENAEEGITIHSCAFGEDGGIDAEKMNFLATGSDGLKGFGGEYHSTATALSTEAAQALTENFLSILVASVPSVELLGAVDASAALVVDPNVRRAVFLLTSDQTATLNGPAMSSFGTGTPAAGMRWWAIDNPAAGNYFLSFSGAAPAAGAVSFHGLVDLQLRSRFAVEGPSTAGGTLKLVAKISDGGRPVSGAHVWAKVTPPGHSVGELVHRYVRVIQSAGAIQVPGVDLHPENRTKEAILNQAARDYFGMSGKRCRPKEGIVLAEVEGQPGTYEAPFRGTSHEGSYGFHFAAEGAMIEGGHFQRAKGLSRYLTAEVSGNLSGLSWIPGPISDQFQSWTLAIDPVTVTGFPLGPGKELQAGIDGFNGLVPLVADLQGNYVASVQLLVGATLPRVAVLLNGKSVLIAGANPALSSQRVRIVLDRIQILDAQESWVDPGEFRFDSVVAVDRDLARAVRRTVPEQGEYKLNDDDSVDVGVVLFDGSLDAASELSISIGGTEFDWTQWGDSVDQLTTYRRVFRGDPRSWAGKYGPDQESDDPENVSQWRLWYHIDVIG